MKKHYRRPTLTVGELRAALNGLSNDLPVVIMLPDKQNVPESFAFCKEANYCGNSAISNPEFMILAGETYDY